MEANPRHDKRHQCRLLAATCTPTPPSSITSSHPVSLSQRDAVEVVPGHNSTAAQSLLPTPSLSHPVPDPAEHRTRPHRNPLNTNFARFRIKTDLGSFPSLSLSPLSSPIHRYCSMLMLGMYEVNQVRGCAWNGISIRLKPSLRVQHVFAFKCVIGNCAFNYTRYKDLTKLSKLRP